MSEEIVVAVIDERTCNKCLALDSLDPDAVGYPPYHDDTMQEEEPCRCMIRRK